MSNNDKQTIKWMIWAVVLFAILYRFWFYIVGGLAIFGVAYMIREYNRNNHNH